MTKYVKKSGPVFETDLTHQIFDLFIDHQLEKISECLEEKDLKKFILTLLDSLVQYVIRPLAIDIRQTQDQLQSMIIRLNDIVSICTEFPDFKNTCCRQYLKIEPLCESAEQNFDKGLIQIL